MDGWGAGCLNYELGLLFVRQPSAACARFDASHSPKRWRRQEQYQHFTEEFALPFAWPPLPLDRMQGDRPATRRNLKAVRCQVWETWKAAEAAALAARSAAPSPGKQWPYADAKDAEEADGRLEFETRNDGFPPHGVVVEEEVIEDKAAMDAVLQAMDIQEDRVLENDLEHASQLWSGGSGTQQSTASISEQAQQKKAEMATKYTGWADA